MLYIDAFNHILPKKYQAVLEQKVPNRDMSSNLSRYAETVPTLLDLDARFRLMDSVEGYMQVLTLAAPTVESVASPEVAVDLCRFANDEMAELVEKYPDRFAAAIAALPLNDLDASLEEIDRAIRDLRLRGIQMYSDVNGMPLDAEALYPIYEKMERYNLPILIHPKRSPALPDYPGEENSRYRAWTKLGWPVASSMAMFRLVYGGVMERFPNLKIVTHHCGGVIPYLAGRMEWNDDFNEMRMGHKDILFPHKPLEYFRRMYYDTANNGYPAGLRCGMDFAGIGKLVFATDLPFCNQKGLRLIRDSIAAVDALDLAPGDRRKVFQSNAVDLFRRLRGGSPSDVWTGKAPRTGLNPVRNVVSKNIFKPNLSLPHPNPAACFPLWPPGASPAPRLRERARSPFPQRLP